MSSSHVLNNGTPIVPSSVSLGISCISYLSRLGFNFNSTSCPEEKCALPRRFSAELCHSFSCIGLSSTVYYNVIRHLRDGV